MTNFDDKRSRLSWSIHERRMDWRSSNRYVSRRWFWFYTVFTCFMVFGSMVAAFQLGKYNVRGELAYETGKTVSTGEYNITLLPEDHGWVEGDVIGYNNVMHNQHFYIEHGLSKNQMASTCEHELMHDLGLQGGDTRAHTYIYLNDDDVDSVTCIKFIQKLKQQNYWRN